MKMEKLQVLSNDEIELIHSASLDLLSSVGIKIDAKDTREILKENGAETDNSTNFVKFPEDLVKEQLKKVPNSFKVFGSDGSFNFEINTNSMIFATIGTPVKIYDPLRASGVRKTILEDTIKQIRIVDALENISCSNLDVWPNDISYTAIHAHCIYQWAKNTKKPYGMGCIGRLASQDMMNMVSILVGGEDELINRPRLIGYFSPTSPLHFPQLMTNGFEVFAKYKQPTIIPPEALAGSSAPVTLAGLLTQTNAEIIGGAILSQIYNPGAPIFYGTVSHITDMRSGNSAMGSVETGLITAGIAQMARFYNIPSRGPGLVTDSKLLDLQNGFERFQTLLLAAQAGINYITCAGTYEATLVEALELLVIDDELAGMVKRAVEGIKVNEETIGLDTIKKVATSDKPGVNFLVEKHTRKYMKQELYMPIHKLSNRDRRTTWRKKGSKDIIESAKEKVDQILSQFAPKTLSSDIELTLQNYIKKVEERSLDDYMKAEGMRSGTVSLPGTDIKIN
ncbi:MAG: trimethylamine methyltransferase family protein [Promethearchaeota archaeon]|nr:MAG: trimethylamine methyltransferase family protein [Candidatus Lokiarchaeota archaeon]